MDHLDTLCRGAIIALLLLLSNAIMQQTDFRKTLTAKLAFSFCCTFAIYVFATSLIPISDTARLILRLLEAPNFALLWLFLIAVYLDRELSIWPHWVFATAYSVLMVLERLDAAPNGFSIPLPKWVYLASTLSMLVYIGGELLIGRSEDLVEPRRQSRFVVFLIIVASALISTISTNVTMMTGSHVANLSGLVAVLMSLFVISCLWFTLLPERIFLMSGSKPEKSIELSARQRVLLDRLNQRVIAEEAYRDPLITIGKLAKSLGVGEHTLRKLINQGLGFRNFANYLNSYRISYAKERLISRGSAGISILNIALDAGYNSLSAFNRAFKDIEGMTPSQYRKATA